ncbi:MAG: MFS transporter [Armatimonadetes bacterium]|nr:MFS transporter [Armatimonadota bacterium]
MRLTNPFAALLRWCLAVGVPAPTWSEPERLDYQQRHLRRNFVINLAEGSAWWLGMSFASSATVIPLFVSKLTSSTWPLGIVAALANAGWLLPQLFTANLVERLPHKKAIVVRLGFFSERLPAALWPMVAGYALGSPTLALVLFVTCYGWHTLGSGVIATGWQDMLANCFPERVRGRLLGFMVFIGSGIGLACAPLCARLLESRPFPSNFVLCFALCAAGVMASEIVLCFTREPVNPAVKDHQSHAEYFRELPLLLRADRNLRNFVLARLMGVFGGMSVGFVTVYAVHRWHLPDAAAAWFTRWLMAGQMVGNLAFGTMADRLGHKLPLQIGWTGSCLAFLVALVAPTPAWFNVVFFLMGITAGASFVSGVLMVLELAVPERRATYTGLVNTSLGFAGLASPLIGAGLAELGYPLLFGVSVAAYLVAVIVLTRGVSDPRHGRSDELHGQETLEAWRGDEA